MSGCAHRDIKTASPGWPTQIAGGIGDLNVLSVVVDFRTRQAKHIFIDNVSECQGVHDRVPPGALTHASTANPHTFQVVR